MARLLQKLQEKEHFSQTECVIADYLMEHYREVAAFSTRQLAKETFTSSAAVVRFSQKLGFEGYAEFKLKFLTEMTQYASEPKELFFSEKDTIPSLIDKTFHISTGALKETRENMDSASIMRAIHLLNTTRHIDFFAMGNNLYLAQMMADTFVMVNKYSTVHSSMSMQYLQAFDAPKDHLGFIISRTGENRMLLDIARQLHEQGNPILLVTAVPKSSLAKLADVVLCAATAKAMNEGGPRVFLLSAQYLLDVLWTAFMTRSNYQEARRKDAWLGKHFYY